MDDWASFCLPTPAQVVSIAGGPEAIMIRLAITAAAFEAVAATLPPGSAGYEVKRGDRGDYFVG